MNLFKPTYRAPRKWVLVKVELQQQDIVLQYVIADKQLLQSDTLAWTSVADARELVKRAGKSLPYILHVTGSGLLARITELVPHYKEGLLVTGNEDDFYFSCYECRSTVGVAFVRRSLLAPVIELLETQKVFLWAIHCGPVPLVVLAGETATLQTDYLIELSAGDLKKLERNNGERKRIPTETGFLDSDMAYLHAIDQLTKKQPEAYHQGLKEEERSAVKSNYREYTRFVRLGVGLLAFFLLTLTGNYFYVNHLNNVAAQAEADIAGYGESLALIDRLAQEKQRKLVLVDNSGVQSAHYVSYYLDQIGASVPASVQLTTLETFSLKEPLKPKRKVELEPRQIVITGFSGNSKILDDWMEALEQKPWVNGVELINYVRINDQKATFHLLLKLNE